MQNAARRLADAERLIADSRKPANDTDNPELAECLAHLVRTGVLPRTASGAYLHPRALRDAVGPIPTIGMVFPTVDEMGALAVLLAATQGWNAGVIVEMQVPPSVRMTTTRTSRHSPQRWTSPVARPWLGARRTPSSTPDPAAADGS